MFLVAYEATAYKLAKGHGVRQASFSTIYDSQLQTVCDI